MKGKRLLYTGKQLLYTIGYDYKCCNCGQHSPQFKNESGMEMWKRLHFKRNEDCKLHNKKYELSDGFNRKFTNECGKTHLIKSLFKMPCKITGHKKKMKKEDLQIQKERENYLMKAMENVNYKNQMIKDYKECFCFNPIGKEEDAITQRDICEFQKIMKAKKKREKRQRQKNRKKISKSLTPHHF